MHLHVILCYCSAAQQQGCDSYSSSSGGGSNVFSKSDFSSTVAVEHYRKHLKNSRKKNKQTNKNRHNHTENSGKCQHQSDMH